MRCGRGLFKPGFECVLEQGYFLREPFHGEADDIGERALDVVDDHFAVILRGVTARFVEGFDEGEVVRDFRIRQGAEEDLRDDFELHGPPAGLMHKADGGSHFMGAARQAAEHGQGFVEICGFAEGAVFDGDEGVCTDDDGVGVKVGDAAGLERGILAGQLVEGDVFIVVFVHRDSLHREDQSSLRHELAAAGGGGGEDDFGRHAEGPKMAGMGKGGRAGGVVTMKIRLFAKHFQEARNGELNWTAHLS